MCCMDYALMGNFPGGLLPKYNLLGIPRMSCFLRLEASKTKTSRTLVLD